MSKDQLEKRCKQPPRGPGRQQRRELRKGNCGHKEEEKGRAGGECCRGREKRTAPGVMATPCRREGRVGEAAEESISCLQLRQSLYPSCASPRPGACAQRWPPSAPRSLLPHCHIVSCCFLPHFPSCSLQPWRLGLPVVMGKSSGDRQARFCPRRRRSRAAM